MLLQRRLLLFWVGLLLQQVRRAVGSTGAVDVGFVAAALMAYRIGLAVLVRAARRAERFLRQHPDPRVGAPVD
ncbi:MAG: hypothetical protein JWR41_2313 [Modestobacter sp.]|nr:hypothetical protein [Modestobacter sp.]